MFIRRSLLVLSALFVLTVQFHAESAQAANITLTGFQAVMRSSFDRATREETVSLLVDSSRFGPGGIAGGMAAVGVTPPRR